MNSPTMTLLFAQMLLILAVVAVVVVVVPIAWLMGRWQGEEGRPGPPPGWGEHKDDQST